MRDWPVLGIDDADLHAEGRASAGAMPAHQAAVSDLFAVVHDGRHRRQLGHALGLHELRVRQRRDGTVQQRLVHRRGTEQNAPQR